MHRFLNISNAVRPAHLHSFVSIFFLPIFDFLNLDYEVLLL